MTMGSPHGSTASSCRVRRGLRPTWNAQNCRRGHKTDSRVLSTHQRLTSVWPRREVRSLESPDGSVAPSTCRLQASACARRAWRCRRGGSTGSRVLSTPTPHFGVAAAGGPVPASRPTVRWHPPRVDRRLRSAPGALAMPRCPGVVLGSDRLPHVAPRCGCGDRLRSPGSPDGPTACSPLLLGFGPRRARAARSAFLNRRPACPSQNRTSVRSRPAANPAASPQGSTANPPRPMSASAGTWSWVNPSRPQGWQVGATSAQGAALRCSGALRCVSSPSPNGSTASRAVPSFGPGRSSARAAEVIRPTGPDSVAFGASALAAATHHYPVARMVFLLSRPGGGASAPLAARTARRRPATAGPGSVSGFGRWQHQVPRPVRRWVRHPMAPTSRFACPEVSRGGMIRRVGSAGVTDVSKSTHLERAGSEQRASPVSRGRFSSSVSKGKQSTSRRQRPPRGGRTPREEKALKGEPHGRYRHETRSEGVAGSKALRG